MRATREDMKKILVAIRPEDTGMMSEALGSDFDTVVCFSLSDAQARLEQGDIAVVACGLHFADGRMFDFLKHAKSNEHTRSIPFYCLKGVDGPLSRAIYQSIVIATEALGATGFIDIADLSAKLGKQQTYGIIRAALREVLGAETPS